MPSLIRFLLVIGILVGAVYAGIFALATHIKPQQREIVVTIPPDRFTKQR